MHACGADQAEDGEPDGNGQNAKKKLNGPKLCKSLEKCHIAMDAAFGVRSLH